MKEVYALSWSFIYCFCILAAYYILRPLRDQLAVEVGSLHLPLFFAITFLATLVLTQVFSWLVSRFRRLVIMQTVYLFFIVCQVVFMLLWQDRELLSLKSLGLLFFVWVSVFNLFVISVFWSFMTDIWSDDQARRLFPLIALGGTLGALFGPIVTRSLVELIGTRFLLLVSIALLVIVMVCIQFLEKWAQNNGKSSYMPLGGGILDGLKQIFTSPFIATMSLMMILSDAIGTIAYVLVTDYSGATFPHDPIAQTQFGASMDLTSNLLQIILQLTLTRWILVRYGAGITIALSAAVVACASLLLLHKPSIPIFGIFPPIALVLIITRSLAHSMVQSARESLYTLVPRTLRYKGKNAVDTAIWRAGDVISLLSISGLRTLGVTIAGFGLISSFLAITSGWIGFRLANRVEKGEFEKK